MMAPFKWGAIDRSYILLRVLKPAAITQGSCMVPSPAEAASVEVSLSGDIITTSWVVHDGVGELADGCMAICPHLEDWTA